MGEIEFFTLHSLLPLALIVVIMILSGIYSFKIALHERFKKLNNEIEEIENLEKN